MNDPVVPKSAFKEDVRGKFAGTENAYLLPHHVEEVNRLQRQHAFIATHTGGKLTHAKLPKGASILDVGCSDGTWLADLAGLRGDGPVREDLKLCGVDIGDALFRKDDRLDLKKHDIRYPFPESWGWKNKFDLVHQRLLVWGIKANEWDVAVKNLVDTVKPGGTIQLVEAEWVKLDGYTDEQVQQKKLALVQEWSAGAAGMDVHIWKRLPSLLESLNLKDIHVESFPLGYGATTARPEDRDWTGELLPESFRQFAGIMPADGIPGVAKTPEEYLAWLDDLIVEFKAIGYTPIVKWVTGKKSA